MIINYKREYTYSVIIIITTTTFDTINIKTEFNANMRKNESLWLTPKIAYKFKPEPSHFNKKALIHKITDSSFQLKS